MQSSPSPAHPQLPVLQTQMVSDGMTGSNPVSPASSSSPASSGAGGISPQHIAQDSSLDGPLGPPDGATAPLEGLSLSQAADLANRGPKWEKSHAEIAEQAKHEAEIETRIAELRKEGFWSLKRLPKVPEPPRPKGHWDYLCEEMQWLSADFAQERRWKRGVARKVVRMVIRHHEEQRQKEERARREEQAKLRRIASSMAKDVRQFWSNVEKVVQFKQQSRLEEKRKKALDLHLDFIVGQTEKYSDLLSQSLNQPPASSKAGSSPCLGSSSAASSPPPPVSQLDDEDGDFQPQEEEEEDDEETIEVEEQQEGNDAETQRREIELLRREGELPLEELLRSLPPQLLGGPSSSSRTPSSRGSDTGEGPEEGGEEEPSQVLKVKPPPSVTQRNKQPWHPDEDDEEFTANEDEAEDEEDTIAAEEQLEGDVDHATELSELAREGELSVEELLRQYAGAYASDASAPGSASSEEEEELEASSSDSEPEGAAEEESSSQSDSSAEQSQDEDGEHSEEEETNGSSESEESESDESEETPPQSQAEEDEDDDFGVEYLLARDEEQSEADGGSGPPTPGPATTLGPKKEITDIAAAAESLQPKGYTLATTQVKTPIPLLLRGQLREYQHIGLDWLVTMYEKKLNGILADEMGLGKTIQTISLLAHLACEKGNWGPHLIIVPTSVMLNWEMELKRWCPSFKILTYYGAQKERKLKRQGWTKPNAFHVCITSYKLVLQDHQAFRRKNWRYLILDEAQNIKNFKSQRWQSLLNFNSQRRLLLTGTPLQNSLMELWSLMHFLMPHVFQSHREFKEWFSNPLTGMIEGSQEYNEGLVKRLHKVLRPFLLRRVKVDVEKQMPKKYEHVIRCRLSKRQRCLYDDFMAQTTTKETLATGHFMSVINILMQLRKVCNHPNLFDPRPVTSPFITPGICLSTASLVLGATDVHPLQRIDMGRFDLIGLEGRVSRYEADTFLPRHRLSRRVLLEVATAPDPPPRPKPVKMKVNRMLQPMPKQEGRTVVVVNSPRTLLGSVPVRPPPGPELSAQPSPGPTPPVLPAPLLVSASPAGPPPIPAPRPPVLLPPPQPNSGPLPQVLPSPLGVLSGTSRPLTPTLSLKPSPPAPVRLSPAPPPGSSSLLKPLTVPPGYNFPSAAATTAPAPSTAVPAPAPQRLILSPDMQARLPSGEVVSIGQLASLAQRPVASAGGSKPLTFQIQGNKLTLTGAQVRQLAVGQPRPLQRNVVHLVSAGGQHHLISQPAHVALIQAVAPTPGPTPVSVLPSSTPSTTPAPTGLSLPLAANQVPPTMVNNTGVVKIVVRQAPRDGLTPVPPLAPAPRPPSSGLSAVLTPRPTLTPGRLPTPTLGAARAPIPTSTLGRPVLKLVHSPSPEVSASAPGAAPLSMSSSLPVPSSLPGPASSSAPVPNSSPLASPVSSTVSAPASSALPISVASTPAAPASTPLTIPISASLPVSASGPTLIASVTPTLAPVVSAAPGPPSLAPAGASPSASGLTLGLATAPSLSPSQAPAHPLLLAPASSHVPGLSSAAAPACSPVLVPASSLANSCPAAPNPAPAQASLLAPAPSASQALATSLAPMAAPQTAILATPAPSLAPLPVLAPSQTPVPVLASSSAPGIPLASASSLVPVPTPVLAPSSTQTMVPAKVPSPLPSPASAQAPALPPALAPTLGGSSPSQTLSLGTGNPHGLFPAQTLSLTPASPLVPTPAQTLSLAPVPPLGPTQTLSLAPVPPLGPTQTLSLAPAPPLAPAPMGPSPAHSLTLAPVSSSASLLAPASVQTLTLSPAPFPVPTLGPAAAQTLTLAPASAQAPASQASSLVVSTSGAASLPVTMVSRLPVSKDEPETLTLRSGPPSPTATSFSGSRPRRQPPPPPRSPFYLDSLEEKRKRQRSERLERIFQLSEAHGALAPVYGTEVLDFCTLPQPVASPVGPRSPRPSHPTFWTYTEAACRAVLFPQQRLDQLSEIIERFIFVMPPVEAPAPSLHACHPPPWLAPRQAAFQEQLACELWPQARPLHRIVCNMRTQFPDLRLIQYDCGKLQTLAVLLRQLKAEGHRVLIFTQMTRMLDVLEQFLTYHGHLYLRLDGSTRVEQRQALMERFNADKRIFCFILSTRSGGVGVNLTGADTVVFYDSDWNPTMDAQAQDRCHRIGQTRDVHIYRLISERTVEENILKKANQKRMLGDMAIEGGNFTTAYFKQQTIRELFEMPLEEPSGSSVPSAPEEEEETVASKQTHILEQALCRAEDEEDIRAATQAKAEQVAELAEFNENEGFPAGEGEEAGRPGAEDEEMSRAEQEIAALVEQLTPIERYAMKFLEASLEEVSREELKQAEEQVEAARKDLDQAKEEVFRLPQEEEEGPRAGDEISCGPGGGSHRRSKKVKGPERPGTRVSERLRGARAETQGTNYTPMSSTHQTRGTSTPPRCSPARERIPRPAPRPRPTPVSTPAVIPVPILAPTPISAPNPVTMLPVHILPAPPLPPQMPPSCSSACTPPPACTPPRAHTPPPAQTSLLTPTSPLLLGLPSVPVFPAVTNLPLALGPEAEPCAQPLASAESLGLVETSSKTSSLTLVPPKDLLPMAVEILPASEKSLSLDHSAPSPILEAGSFPSGPEQELPEPAEGTILTVLPGGEELPPHLSENSGLEPPLSAAADEPLEADKNSEELVEAQTPTCSPEKPQDLVPAEVIASSTSSSATSSPEGPSPARPPRRRTSADVEIRGQGAGRPGQPPGPKVLRKLPGRLVTVVEEKELVRRRRQQRGTASTLGPGASETGACPGSPSAHSTSGPESSPPSAGLCEAAPHFTLPSSTQQPFIARRHIELGVPREGSPENGEGMLPALTPPAVKRRRGRPPKKNRSPAEAGQRVDEAPSFSKGHNNKPDAGTEVETLIVAEPVLGPLLSPGPQPLGPQPVHRPESIILSPVEKRRRGRPPKARDLPIPGTMSSPGDGNLDSRTQPLPLPPPLPLLACPTATVANTVTTLTISTSPPKRKRGRPPKNPPSPRPSPLPVLDRDISSVLESCGLGRRRQPQGQGDSEGSSSDEDGSRPLTRLARLRLEAEGLRGRKGEGSMVVAVIQDDLDLADGGPGSLELTPPLVSLAPKLRSTRLRPGSLVPPLETEKVPRKRAGVPVGRCPGPIKRGRLQSPSPLGPEGSVEESEAEASGEEEGDGTPCRRPGPHRPGATNNQGDQRILRSSAPLPLAGPTASHRGRKAKT
ncbi:PREDICTED: helicase SRCAP isoform X1 [Hipposideros armiger]|uniref:Helicase SRCAP isoform X1 n=2 Tax=Hipposideros armiger TaxID=186990 RepID=A0A8B7Q6M7_HIPAR|nr:PREDICTED: helicase SRCAP isoform X1 [Hipposideros armiger]XP_019484092.1 PREDICTED: helicase SRCAP isoform X1 [Hipposideros armiger]XP_019484093.1 PREDICTED: helicase SRCAP isoform X1 [Hipposideros armiger]XP_019484094.1 PREDICTED: helicase SRCAP isoform X1 [Hipposideros armiger]XP_019484095.1 PREDICTED: helicase SRCAP isoform X1 [Hipposideros armiger]